MINAHFEVDVEHRGEKQHNLFLINLEHREPTDKIYLQKINRVRNSHVAIVFQ